MRRKRRGTYLPDGNPYLPVIAAICAHLLVMALIVFLPSIALQREPEQVVTINLIDLPAPPASAGGGPPPKTERQAESKPAAKPQAKPEPAPEPAKIEATPVKEKAKPEPPPPPKKIEPKPVKEKPAPEVVKEPPPPPKAVSLKPRQVKKLAPEPPKQEVVKKRDDKAIKREMDKIREQLAQEEKRRELSQLRKQLAQEGRMRDQKKREQAAAEERAAAAEAARLTRQLEEYKDQARLMEAREQGLGSGASRSQTSDKAQSASSSGADSALASQYYSRIAGQLQSYWKLPDFKDWPPSMVATVAVTIDKSGKILDVQFEKRSGDDAFDRLVRKTLDDADPLPPIPPALKKERLEIGFHFKPGSITGR
ncbi:MAG: cell envelope integrity protein TolA [Desulfobulbaceae bacterium]|nr:cell envelope integrity protein TolA [Desulfobulbaceae bacterium]